MQYMDVNTASRKWGITGRRVRILCNDGRIDGAVRNGWSWLIPADAPKPGDGRVLRRFRNLDIRPGFVDVEALEEAREGVSVSDSSSSFVRLLPSTISYLFLLDGKEVSSEDVKVVLEGELCYSLSLQEHLLIVNFTSILKNLFHSRDKWNGGALREIYIRLMQGIKESDGEYDREYIESKDEEEKVSVKAAMETMLKQYEDSWSLLHPLSSSAIISGEIGRISPYDTALSFFLYLVLSGELIRGDVLPPLLDSSLLFETKAAFSLVSSKGVYTDLTSLMERMVLRSYVEIKKNV